MQETPKPRVLLVDDDENILQGLMRTLRRRFDVATARSAAAGTALLNPAQPFAVVVSDLKMPGGDGVAFLGHVRTTAPETIRILLTGHADVESAIAAVNRGEIFRFLTKPCRMPDLERALDAAAEQYRLVQAERLLLEQTLRGSIKALTDVLTLVNPAGFGRATRIKRMVTELAEAVGEGGGWQIEVAAMLSQIGTVTLPGQTVERLYQGAELSYPERLAVERLPRIAADVVGNIPRLEDVGAILLYQNSCFDGRGAEAGAPTGKELPWAARALKIVNDCDLLEAAGAIPEAALREMRGRIGWYDPELLDAFSELHCRAQERIQIIEIDLRSVRPGMVFAEDVTTTTGILLIARGQEASERLVDRIRNLLHLPAAQQKVRVIAPGEAGEP